MYVVIEARIPTPEDLEGKESIQFPAVTNMSTNLSLMFDNMTPMIEIPSAAIVFRQLEEGLYKAIHIIYMAMIHEILLLSYIIPHLQDTV